MIALVLALIAVCALCAACAGNNDNKDEGSEKTTESAAPKLTDPKQIADALISAGDFEGELDAVSEDYAKSIDFFGLPEDVKLIDYKSTAYSDEVAVFKSSDAGAVKSIVESYVETRVATFKDYAPDQSKKADENAAIVVSGDIVVLLISNASSADAKALVEKTVG